MTGHAIPVLPDGVRQGSAEWLAARRQGVTATDVPALLGLSPWRTPVDVWRDKTGDQPQPVEETPAMRWGHLLEPLVADEWWRTQTDTDLLVPPAIVCHPDDPLALASLDRVAVQPGRELVVEIKTTSRSWDVLPEYVQVQVLWQLHVTGLDEAVVVQLDHRKTLTEWPVTADGWWAAQTVDAVHAWWDAHVLADRMPRPSAGDDLARLWQPEPGQVADVDGDLWGRYVTARRQRESWAGQENDALRLVQQEVAQATEVRVDGRTVATWRPARARTTWDTKRLAKDHPDLAARYTTTGTASRTWRLTKETTSD